MFNAIAKGLGGLGKKIAQAPQMVKSKLPDLRPKIEVDDAPPPSIESRLPKRPPLVDPSAVLGDAPIKKIGELPPLPERKPLEVAEKKGFKNRLKGAWEGLQNAGAHGATGQQAIGAMIGGAINRETPNRQLWEQRELLPAVRRREAEVGAVTEAQKAYDTAAERVEKRNKTQEDQYKTDLETAKWAEGLRQTAAENEAKRRDTAEKNKLTVERDKATRNHQIAMRRLWEAHDKSEAAKDRSQGITLEEMRERADIRREKFRADNNLERDFYRYLAETPDNQEPSEEEIQQEVQSSAAVGMPQTKEQAAATIKRRTPQRGKPGAKNATDLMQKRFGGSWGNVPAGK